MDHYLGGSLTDKSISAFARVAPSIPMLQVVYLSVPKLSDDGVAFVCAALLKCPLLNFVFLESLNDRVSLGAVQEFLAKRPGIPFTGRSVGISWSLIWMTAHAHHSTLIGSRKLALNFLQHGIVEGVPTEIMINYGLHLSIYY